MQKKLVKTFIVSSILLVLLILSNEIAVAGWTEMDSGTDVLLSGVWGSSGSDVFAVGGYNNNFILHYDGNSWSEMDVPYVNFGLDGVWGSSSKNVFAVGSSILHYDGSTWSEMERGTLPYDVAFRGTSIWGSSSIDIFVVGVFQILHYDGNVWSLMNSEVSTLSGVWGSSSSNVYAVGMGADEQGVYGVIHHYNGSTWSEMFRDRTTISFTSVWGSAADDVFALGAFDIYHYDGLTWSVMENLPLMGPTAIWGSSRTDVFAAALSGIYHYDGLTWSRMESSPSFGPDINAIWGSSGSDVFAVGDSGIILHYDGIITNTTTTTGSNTSTTIFTPISPCTAEKVYGEFSKETELLRYFRNNILSETPEGRELIKLYYQWSPVIVKAMKEDEEFKEQVKETIDVVLLLMTKETN